MISLRSSTSDGSSYQVFDDGTFLGLVRVIKSTTCDKYVAVVPHRAGEEGSTDKEFDTPHDAMHWIEKHRGGTEAV